MPDLIARVAGGLGNQLFIYATARALAQRSGARLVLDTKTGFRHDAYRRRFGLGCFGVHFKEANVLERFDFPGGRALRFGIRKINQTIRFQNRFYIVEAVRDKRAFMPEMMALCPFFKVWLEGYWQSPQYFEDIRPTLQQELRVQAPLSDKTLEIADQIRNSNSVCVHLRLVRHIIGGTAGMADRNLENGHYGQSIRYMAERLENPRFFCFADNPDVAGWLRQLPFDVVFVTHNKGDERAYEDFYLMSLCRHFVLSNSTFCWWPAWLSDAGGLVISPPLNYWDNKDILPSNWLPADKL